MSNSTTSGPLARCGRLYGDEQCDGVLQMKITSLKPAEATEFVSVMCPKCQSWENWKVY